MTKAKLIKALEGLPNDTRIYISSIKIASDVLPASYVQIKEYGSDGEISEVTILGDE